MQAVRRTEFECGRCGVVFDLGESGPFYCWGCELEICVSCIVVEKCIGCEEEGD